jgi:integrase/recombinase XerD
MSPFLPGESCRAPLHQRLLHDLQMRNLSPHTQKAYLRNRAWLYVHAVVQLALYHHKSPDLISPREVRAYFLYLVNERHVAPGTYNRSSVPCASSTA